MRFVLTPVGSFGDVHPYVGVGKRLRERGHEVVLMTAEPFRELAESTNLDFVCSWPEEEYYATTNDPDLWHPNRGIKLIMRIVNDNMRRGYDLLQELYEPGTVIVGHALSFPSRLFEELHGATAATLHLAPTAFRSDYEQPFLPNGVDPSGWPRWAKRAMWRLVDWLLMDRHVLPSFNAYRAELGLPPVKRVFKSWIHSPRLVVGLFPDWYGRPQRDWPPQLRLVGFPLYDEAGVRLDDPELDEWLGATDEGADGPIVFTPGSANRQAPAFFESALEATSRIGRRALLLTQFPEQLPDPLPEHARHFDYVPLSDVLHRCGGIVHHGGIGTLAQGLKAGVPQLIMPMGFDQPDNAGRLARLGVGDWLVPKKFTAASVAAKLEALTASSEVADACRRYRDAIDGVDAIGATCDLLEGLH